MANNQLEILLRFEKEKEQQSAQELQKAEQAYQDARDAESPHRYRPSQTLRDAQDARRALLRRQALLNQQINRMQGGDLVGNLMNIIH